MKTLILSLAAMAAAFSGSATAQTAPHEVKAREIYARVISFRTAAGQQQTPAMVAYLIETLKAGGVPEADMATLDEAGERALIVRIPGRKPGRPILFSAHMDVVDARREEWERDPFKLIEENGNFYGRGTSDNKAGVVALVSTILRFKAEQLKPARELVFAFVGDEETTMNTTRRIAAHPWVKNAEFAINTDAGGGILDDATGKPLIYLVQGAEKTYATFDLIVTNPGGHSSRPRADNAIYQLAHALEKVEAYRFPVMANDLSRSYLGAVGKAQPGPEGEALRKFSADPNDDGRRRCAGEVTGVRRHDTHHVRRHDAGSRSCRERFAADGEGCSQLPHISWRRRRLGARWTRRSDRRPRSEGRRARRARSQPGLGNAAGRDGRDHAGSARKLSRCDGRSLP